jgi:hypothetical protein
LKGFFIEILLDLLEKLIFITFDVSISDESKHLLEVKLKDTICSYKVSYLEEKYIIISSYLKKNGKIKSTILKQKEKFIFD